MVRRTDPKDDDWQHVQDPKKRKAIQDRLAQRARRQRLREAKGHESQHLTIITRTSKRCNCNASIHTPLQNIHDHHRAHTFSASDSDLDSALALSPPTIDPLLNFLHTPSMNSEDHTDLEFTKSLPYILSPQSQPEPPLTVCSALYLNGSILGLSCSVCVTSRSPFPSPHHPMSLHPTETQLMTVHPRWFDRLPFPKMRDSLIRLIGVIDEEDLLRDLFLMPSWTIETREVGWERASWDARAWKMEKEWEVKWGWLMV